MEIYLVYDNLPISEDDKKDPTKLLDAFECYFKLERNIFQSWYTLGSIYSGAYKTQSEFYHKLNSVANDCNFTNKDEIMKFLYLTHNQNTRVREHLLKELTDTTSLADMLQMARVCEGTVHSEEISKRYLELVKTVKQVNAIHRKNNRPKSNGRGCGGHRSHSQSQSRKPSSCSNCSSNHPPQKCKAYGKECFHCHRKGHFSQLCCSKQCGKFPGLRDQTNNNRLSHHDVHKIDQSKFDDSVQIEDYDYDSITIQFRTQLRHSNVMFDEISSTPALQRVLTNVHRKAIGIGSQSSWLKHRFKIDSGACGNLMPLNMFKLLYNQLPSSTSVNSAVLLLDYNKKEIKQLSTCYVCIRFRSTVKRVHFYVVPDRLKPIIGVSDALALGLISFHCPIYNDWQSDSHIDSVLNSHVNGTGNGTSVGTGTGTGNGNGIGNGTDTCTRGSNGMGSGTHKGTDMANYDTGNISNSHGTSMVHTMPGTLTKHSILTHPKYSHLFSRIDRFQCKPVHIKVKPHSTPVQKPPRWVPIAMSDKFKQELDSMEAQGTISKYDGRNASPEWLSSFVIVKKPNDSLRICLDPTDLNKDIVRPVCNSQTIDDMVHKLKDARYFTIFYTNKGFFQVPLDAESKVLTAMLTPFRIYVYNILAMGLSNATDVFETCIYEVLQGLKGCTNIADDVLVYGSTYEDFKTNVLAFLDHCVREDMHLNPDKVKLDCPEVPFFRNILSKDGLSPDTRKVELIQQWPTPKNEMELVFSWLCELLKSLLSLSFRFACAATGTAQKWY